MVKLQIVVAVHCPVVGLRQGRRRKHNITVEIQKIAVNPCPTQFAEHSAHYLKTTESGGPSGCDAGKKVKGRKRHLVVDVEGFPIKIAIQEASVQDRDGAPAVILGLLAAAPLVRKLWADGGYQGPKLAAALKELGLGSVLEIVEKPKDVKGFAVIYRRWVVERTFAWMSRCQRLVKDYERSLESSLAWAQLAACRFMMRRIARAATC